ncbi:MAG TPA: hypothetical protein VH575_23925 [Gemmataceae bacterium]|jgi:hypothetical protein
MRRKFLIVPFCLLLAAVVGADEPELKTEKRPPSACHGTAVDFVATPVEAAQLAKKEKKLVLVLHVSGYFEDPDFT